MRKKRKSGDGGFNVWRSYSDVMAGVLLLFILIMSLTLFQAQKSYDESIQERDEKLALQAEYTADLLAKQNTIEEQEGTIKTKDEKLTALAQTLAEQEAKLKEQQALLNQQQTDLDEKTTQLSEQQTKIDNIIGVKAEVVEALQKEFQKNNINVNLDSKTGALTLDASVLFDVDESELTDAGKEALRNVLPIYCKVLMEDTYKNYLAEIIIDGYTDTDGDYAYNLELSQQRSLAVAQYLLDIQGEFLTEDQSLDLQDYLTVNGHSMANPILDADGNVVEQTKPKALRSVCTKAEAELMDEFLTYVITNGTAAAGGSQYARVSGKTGSAQYDSTKNYHAWFCGYGTNDVSEIAVCVMIEKGGAGGIVAAPVAGQIFDYYFSR